MTAPVTVIRPPAGWPGFGWRETWRYRSICVVLAQRLLKVRYRQTVIGAGWAVLQPLLLMLVFTIFFTLMDRYPAQGLPFPVFFLLGLLPYHVASKVLTEGSASVVANGALVNRVHFPRVYFPVATSIPSLVNLLFGFVPLAFLLAWYGVVPGWELVTVPSFVAIAYGASLGLSLWLSALNVAYRDITQLLPFLAQLWMFASPVIYPSEIIPESWRWAFNLNPLVCVVEGFRWAFAGTPPPAVGGVASGAVVAGLLLGSGYLLFRQRESTFADVV